MFTGTTSSLSRTTATKVAVAAVVRQTGSGEATIIMPNGRRWPAPPDHVRRQSDRYIQAAAFVSFTRNFRRRYLAGSTNPGPCLITDS